MLHALSLSFDLRNCIIKFLQLEDILDPKNDSLWCVELRDAIGSLANVMQSCTRVTSKWSGYSSPKSRMRQVVNVC